MPLHSSTSPISDKGSNQKQLLDAYDRVDWGGWIDEDGDCEDTRAGILIRDSQAKVSFVGCRVVSGLWNQPYSGGSTTNASQIDIDHIIPLKWAHGHGGDRWSVSMANRIDPVGMRTFSWTDLRR